MKGSQGAFCRQCMAVYFKRCFFTLLIINLFTFELVVAGEVGYLEGEYSVSQGAASYTIPIQVPPGVAGMQPSLSIAYSSQGGGGLLGQGWGLEGLSTIHRCTKTLSQDDEIKGIDFSESDRFCVDGQRLVAISGSYGEDETEYRTEIESFSKIVSYGAQGTGPSYWKVWTKSGQILEYGNSSDSKIEAQGRDDVFVWAANKISDTVNNSIYITYEEDSDNGEYYPSIIEYGDNSVIFSYEQRPDPDKVFVHGSLVKSAHRLVSVETYVGTVLANSHKFNYLADSVGNRSVIESIEYCDSSQNCLEPTRVEWITGTNGSYNQIAGISTSITDTIGGAKVDISRVKFGDFNGDGVTDIYKINGYGYDGVQDDTIHLSKGDGTYDTIEGISTGIAG
ncbi:MAG: SpvB/TcaC N-terminal domain-containing protein, partial [Candidatus Thiodiazotropha sp.]